MKRIGKIISALAAVIVLIVGVCFTAGFSSAVETYASLNCEVSVINGNEKRVIDREIYSLNSALNIEQEDICVEINEEEKVRYSFETFNVWKNTVYTSYTLVLEECENVKIEVEKNGEKIEYNGEVLGSLKVARAERVVFYFSVDNADFDMCLKGYIQYVVNIME